MQSSLSLHSLSANQIALIKVNTHEKLITYTRTSKRGKSGRCCCKWKRRTNLKYFHITIKHLRTSFFTATILQTTISYNYPHSIKNSLILWLSNWKRQPFASKIACKLFSFQQQSSNLVGDISHPTIYSMSRKWKHAFPAASAATPPNHRNNNSYSSY